MQLLSGQQYSPLYILMYTRHILESYVKYGNTYIWWTTTKEQNQTLPTFWNYFLCAILNATLCNNNNNKESTAKNNKMCVIIKPFNAFSRNYYQSRRLCQWAWMQILSAILYTVREIQNNTSRLFIWFSQRKTEIWKFSGYNFWTASLIYVKFCMRIPLIIIYVSTKFRCDTMRQSRIIEY